MLLLLFLTGTQDEEAAFVENQGVFGPRGELIADPTHTVKLIAPNIFHN